MACEEEAVGGPSSGQPGSLGLVCTAACAALLAGSVTVPLDRTDPTAGTLDVGFG
jgi:hypothetical protein